MAKKTMEASEKQKMFDKLNLLFRKYKEKKPLAKEVLLEECKKIAKTENWDLLALCINEFFEKEKETSSKRFVSICLIDDFIKVTKDETLSNITILLDNGVDFSIIHDYFLCSENNEIRLKKLASSGNKDFVQQLFDYVTNEYANLAEKIKGNYQECLDLAKKFEEDDYKELNTEGVKRLISDNQSYIQSYDKDFQDFKSQILITFEEVAPDSPLTKFVKIQFDTIQNEYVATTVEHWKLIISESEKLIANSEESERQRKKNWEEELKRQQEELQRQQNERLLEEQRREQERISYEKKERKKKILKTILLVCLGLVVLGAIIALIVAFWEEILIGLKLLAIIIAVVGVMIIGVKSSKK
ncbi:MAG: hypothetical protein ACOXZK_02910 [Bacteroidales bacterium]